MDCLGFHGMSEKSIYHFLSLVLGVDNMMKKIKIFNANENHAGHQFHKMGQTNKENMQSQNISY